MYVETQFSVNCSEINMERHLVCEPCGGNVLGGYDPKKKQVRCTYIPMVLNSLHIVVPAASQLCK